MKAHERILSDSMIESLLKEARPDAAVPADVDLRIREMIRMNTSDAADAPSKRGMVSFPARRFALPLAAAFFVGIAMSVFFATDYFRSDPRTPAWGSVLSFNGDVTSTAKGNSAPVTSGYTVTGNATFTTGKSSSCLLLLQDGSKLFLAENTSAAITRLTKDSKFTARITLNNGTVCAKVRKLSRGSEFSVRAGLLKAEVRGTEFMVVSTLGETPYVAVRDGAVKVSRTDRKAAVFAHANEKAFVSDRGIGMTQISAEDGQFIALASGNDRTAVIENELLGGKTISASNPVQNEQKPAAQAKTSAPDNNSFTVAASAGWINSGISVHSGDIIEISAAGSITSEAGTSPVGPNGDTRENNRPRICPSAPFGSLIMSSDGGKNIIYIGTADKFRATSDGQIIFSVNDSRETAADNKGSFAVKVTVKRK
jgi:hypothetical protein